MGYGNGTTPDAKLCGVGEMWGYAMGHIQEDEKYDPAKFEKPYSYNNADWLKPHVFWDLYRGHVLTKKQIYGCLTADVDTYKMYGNYPEKVDMIEKAFTDNKIILNVTKPDTGDITHDAFYTDKTVAYSIIFQETIFLLRMLQEQIMRNQPSAPIILLRSTLHLQSIKELNSR